MIHKIPELKKQIITSAVGIVILTGFIWLVGKRPYDTTSYVLLLCCTPALLSIFMGIFIINSATIYHRIVDDGVEPDSLVKDQICYLNGEFKAKFLYKHGYTGKFVFKVDGLEKEISVLPGRVRMYFSSQKEV